MGLFGELDANDVSDNPFYVAPDTYKCILAEASRVQKKDGSGEGLSFKWIIEDEGDFEGNSLSDWNNIFPDVTEYDVTPEIKKSNARTKARLIQMGLTPDQMNTLLDDDNLDALVGMEAYVEVSESTDKNDPDKKYTNVKKVAPIDE